MAVSKQNFLTAEDISNNEAHTVGEGLEPEWLRIEYIHEAVMK
ncbi:MAG: hypothetical protein RBS82_12690 [Syntrophales bacterium]|jgi:hypothetical protein|nr:hypothetical protein [Syntrophales bacterium]